MIIVRIAKLTGDEGGTQFVFHADVHAASEAEALQAANEERVRVWRLIEQVPKKGLGEITYAVVGTVAPQDAVNPHEAVSREMRSVEMTLAEVRGVKSVHCADGGAVMLITLLWRGPQVRKAVDAAAKKAGYTGRLQVRNANI